MTKTYIKKPYFIATAIDCGKDPQVMLEKFHKDGHKVDINSVKLRLKKFILKGYIPLDSGNKPELGMNIKKVSTMHGPDGEVKLQWVTSENTVEKQLEVFEDALSGILSAVPKHPLIEAPTISDEDTMSVYTIGDAHIGMLAWSPETGEDHGLEKAEHELLSVMQLMVSQSTNSKEAFIIDVGDYFHSDNASNTTSKSGNTLDVDGRYSKVLEVGLHLTYKLIDMALAKHEVVHWRSAIGNHNEHSAVMMNQFVKAWYRDEPRVVVHDSPSIFMYHQFGKNLIGVTHGHTVKADKLGEIMSVDQSDAWSSTKHRYWYTGHIHHQTVKEYPSCVVETFRTLAPKDAWHSGAGYRSGQDMKCITLHKDHGEISRNTTNISRIS